MTNQNEKDLVTRSLEDADVRREVEREWFIDETILQIEQKMDELKISRTELANRLECSPPNVTQILRHGSNLTLGTLMDIALAIGHRFLSPTLVPLSASPPWESSKAQVVPISHTDWVAQGEAVAPMAYTFVYAGGAIVSPAPSGAPYSETDSGGLNA